MGIHCTQGCLTACTSFVGLIKEKEKLPVDQKQWTVVASVETTIIAQRVVLVWKETMLL